MAFVIKRRRISSDASRPFKKPRQTIPSISAKLGIERKFYDTSLVAATLVASTDGTGGEHNPASTIMLNTVPQGSGESEHLGRKFNMDSIEVTGLIRIPTLVNQTVLGPPPIIFLAIVIDKQANGAALDSENVFKNKSANAFLAANPLRNLEFLERFTILTTKTLKVVQEQSTYDGTNMEVAGSFTHFHMFHNLKGMSTTMLGTTGNVSNVTDRALQFVAYTNETGPLLYYNARLRYRG